MSDQPNFIEVYQDAYSQQFCDEAITYFENMKTAGLCQSRGVDENADKLQKDDEFVFASAEEAIALESSRFLSHQFSKVFWEVCYKQYSQKYSILQGMAKHFSYAQKIQKTEVGGGYHVWHTESPNRSMSHRILVWTVYLNDVEEGGETEFLYQHMRVKAKAGTCMIFPAAFTHVHRGNPPISNSKYIITGWVEF
jgi:hypothetical protein